MFDIITFGSAAWDTILKPKKLTSLKYDKESLSQKEVCFPLGSKIDIDEIHFNSGGGGTNAATTFVKQGFKTAFCGMTGKDLAGQEIIGELKRLKINTKFVFSINKKPTNHSIVILGENHERTILAYRGAAELISKESIPWKKLKTKWIYLAPLTGLLCDTFLDIIEFARKYNIKIAVNPSIAQLSLKNFSEIAKKIDVLILNQEEASFLTKISLENEHAIFKKIDEICSGIAVMTKGGKGVVVSDGKHIYSAMPNSKRVIADTTGAGDSFSSGFVSEFMKSGDVEKAIQFGMANSEGCLSQIGAKNGLLKKGQSFEPVKVDKSLCDNSICIVK